MTRYELPSSPICYIDQYNEEQQLVKREEYNWQGILCRVQSFVPHSGALYLEELINDDGSIYMEIIYPGDAKRIQFGILIGIKTGIQTFTKKTDIKQLWLSSIQSQNDRLKLMITEDRDQDRHLFKIDQPETTYYAAFVHHAHYEEDLHQVNSQYRELFKQIRKQQVDAVFLGILNIKKMSKNYWENKPIFILFLLTKRLFGIRRFIICSKIVSIKMN